MEHMYDGPSGAVIALPGTETAWMAMVAQNEVLDRTSLEQRHGRLNNHGFCDIVDRFIGDACTIMAQMCTAWTRRDDHEMWSLIAALRLACHRAGALRMGRRASDLAKHFADSPLRGWASFNRSLEVMRTDLDEVWALGTEVRRIK